MSAQPHHDPRRPPPRPRALGDRSAKLLASILNRVAVSLQDQADRIRLNRALDAQERGELESISADELEKRLGL